MYIISNSKTRVNICVVIYLTGPDGLRDHKVPVVPDMQFIGDNVRSREDTAALSYMFRASKGVPFPLAKNGRIGEIGWEVEFFRKNKVI